MWHSSSLLIHGHNGEAAPNLDGHGRAALNHGHRTAGRQRGADVPTYRG